MPGNLHVVAIVIPGKELHSYAAGLYQLNAVVIARKELPLLVEDAQVGVGASQCLDDVLGRVVRRQRENVAVSVIFERTVEKLALVERMCIIWGIPEVVEGLGRGDGFVARCGVGIIGRGANLVQVRLPRGTSSRVEVGLGVEGGQGETLPNCVATGAYLDHEPGLVLRVVRPRKPHIRRSKGMPSGRTVAVAGSGRVSGAFVEFLL